MVLLPLLLVLLQLVTTLAAPAACSLKDRRGCQAPEDTQSGPLLIYVSVQDRLLDTKSLFVRTTIVNTGDKPLKILNDPNTPLNSARTHSFDFYYISEIGAKPSNVSCPDACPSNGVVWNDYDPYEAAAKAEERAYITLEPKQKKVMEHDLSGMYMFDKPGLYTVQVTQNARYFAFVKDDGSVDFTQARIFDGPKADKAAAIDVSESAVKSGPSVAKRSHPTDFLVDWIPSPMFHQCTPAQQAEVKATIKAAVQRLKDIDAFLARPESRTSRRFTNWFGVVPRARWLFVRANYLSIGAKPANYRYDCTCTKCDRSAFTDAKPTDKMSTIYLCKKFWWAQRTGEDSKVGTLIRESLQFEAFHVPEEYAMGMDDANRLATDFPGRAVYNAGSYRYFAENPRIESYTDTPQYLAKHRSSTYRPTRYRDSRYRGSRNRNPRYRDSRYRDSRYRDSRDRNSRRPSNYRSSNY